MSSVVLTTAFTKASYDSTSKTITLGNNRSNNLATVDLSSSIPSVPRVPGCIKAFVTFFGGSSPTIQTQYNVASVQGGGKLIWPYYPYTEYTVGSNSYGIKFSSEIGSSYLVLCGVADAASGSHFAHLDSVNQSTFPSVYNTWFIAVSASTSHGTGMPFFVLCIA